ncbi:MAG: hypothetical protein IJV62_03155, partial [Eggerthellaceae bacterium]|nr:hypothetical protein [Eggerthellaceae bacterium]
MAKQKQNIHETHEASVAHDAHETQEVQALKEATFSSTLMTFVKSVRLYVIAGVLLTIVSSFFTFIPFVILARIAIYSIEVGIPATSWLAGNLVLAGISALLGRLLFGIATGVCHYGDAQFRVNV